MNGELRRQAGEYLQMRHGIGYELQRPGRLVRQFAANCDAASITHVTIQAALDWAVLPQEVSSWYHWLRLSAVRRARRVSACARPGTPDPACCPAGSSGLPRICWERMPSAR